MKEKIEVKEEKTTNDNLKFQIYINGNPLGFFYDNVEETMFLVIELQKKLNSEVETKIPDNWEYIEPDVGWVRHEKVEERR